MSGIVKSVGKAFGSILGIGKVPKVRPTEAPTLKPFQAPSSQAIAEQQSALQAAQAELAAFKNTKPQIGGGKPSDRMPEQQIWTKQFEALQGKVSSTQKTLQESQRLAGLSDKLAPLQRNPNILAAPGVESKLAQWDELMNQYNNTNAASVLKSGYNPDKGTQSTSSEVARRKGALAKQITALESQIVPNLWLAPQQPATAPTPTQGQAQPQGQASNPAPNEAPASALLENIIGTQLTGTLGTDAGTRTSGSSGPRGRRGRAATILGSGDGSETFGV